MKCGLVLSGGAAWGLANIGILDVLESEDFRCDCVAGSSMGAIVAAAYALGIPLQKIKDTAAQISLLTFARLSAQPFAQGFHSGLLQHQLETILTPLMGDAVIADTKIPFVCIAGKVVRPIAWERVFFPGFTEYFFQCVTPHVFSPETRMIDALLASSAVPVLFSPMKIGSDEFVDLIHFGAIPARHLRSIHHPDILIGTDTNPRYGLLHRMLPRPWREFMERGHKEILADSAVCDLIVKPKMPASVFRFDRANDFIVAGHTAAKKCLPELRSLLRHDRK